MFPYIFEALQARATIIYDFHRLSKFLKQSHVHSVWGVDERCDSAILHKADYLEPFSSEWSHFMPTGNMITPANTCRESYMAAIRQPEKKNKEEGRCEITITKGNLAPS